MHDKYFITDMPMSDDQIIELSSAPKNKWELTFTKPDGWGMVYHLPTAPNRFHRFMQRVILGFYWVEKND